MSRGENELATVARIDADVVGSEVTGPEQGSTRARSQTDADFDGVALQVAMRGCFIKAARAAAPAHGLPPQVNIYAFWLDRCSTRADGRQYPPPIGVGTGKRGLYQRGVRHLARRPLGS